MVSVLNLNRLMHGTLSRELMISARPFLIKKNINTGYTLKHINTNLIWLEKSEPRNIIDDVNIGIG
jgi:hypothetical protein